MRRLPATEHGHLGDLPDGLKVVGLATFAAKDSKR